MTPEFLKNSLQRLGQPNKAASAQHRRPSAVERMRKRIGLQAGLAVLTVVLTVVLVFAMTSAWYTNIVQTNGLTFEAEAWGFDGNITVDNRAIEAGPGDTGVIALEVQNQNENIAAVSVNVSKAKMTKDMQKRLFFFVDTQVVRNGETMDRVYLNTQENYTYTIFSNGTLTLTDTVYNDAQLKWHWVYDVLGYYVLGTANDAGTDVMELEYLRPIEYDYDAATTTYKTVETTEDGEEIKTYVITTVDGETSVEDFLTEYSKTDGYAGEIDPKKVLKSGHYPVAVDENGYGVYAYLCNYTEITLATEFDTQLGQNAANGVASSFPAELTISAQKGTNNVMPVATSSALQTALALENAGIVQLSDNITLPEGETLVIPDGQKVMVDLNGYTISGGTGSNLFQAGAGSSLTLINGTLQAPVDSEDTAVHSVGAEVLMSNMTVENFKWGVHVADHTGTQGLDSKVRILDSSITSGECALLVQGNGSASAGKNQVIVENSSLTGGLYGICGNGTSGDGTAANSGRFGTDIQVLNSQILSSGTEYGAGIYHPQKDSYLTIYNSTVTGYNGVVIKGGHVKILNSAIIGNGAVSNEPAKVGSGYTDTADAVYIETNYPHEISLEIHNEKSEDNSLLETKLTSTAGQSLRIFTDGDVNVSVRIYGGIFQQEQPEAYLAPDTKQEKTGELYKVTEDTAN